jgi:hypothetical protein
MSYTITMHSSVTDSFFLATFLEFQGAVFTGLNDGFADIQANAGGTPPTTFVTLNTTQNGDVVVAGMMNAEFSAGLWPQTVSAALDLSTLENYEILARLGAGPAYSYYYGYDGYTIQTSRGAINPAMSWVSPTGAYDGQTFVAAAFSVLSGVASFYQKASVGIIATHGSNPLTLGVAAPQVGDLLVLFPWGSEPATETVTDNAGGSLGNHWQGLTGPYGGTVFWTVNSQLPIVTTQQPTVAVPLYSVTGNGTLVQPGWNPTTVEGFVWDVVSHSLPGNVAPASSLYPNFVSTSGSFSAPNTFSQLLTGLPSSSTIFIRAAAMNSYGWSYGNEVTAITLSNSPCLIQYGLGY